MSIFARTTRPRRQAVAPAPPNIGDLVSLQVRHWAGCFQVFEVIKLSPNGSKASLQMFPQRVYFCEFEVSSLDIIERRRDRDSVIAAHRACVVKVESEGEGGEGGVIVKGKMDAGEVERLENGMESLRVADEAKGGEVEVQGPSIDMPVKEGAEATLPETTNIPIASSIIAIEEDSKEHVPAISQNRSIDKTDLPILTFITTSDSESESESETDSSTFSPLSRTSSGSLSALSRTSSSGYLNAPKTAGIMWPSAEAEDGNGNGNNTNTAQKTRAVPLSRCADSDE